MKINKRYTTINRESRYGAPKKYIVIHYVGAVSSAEANARYFATGYRGASAHYFVDEEEIWQSVPLKYAAWHCGGGYQDYGTKYGGGKYHGKCTNYNSIGIEMCLYKKDGKYRLKKATVANTEALVKKLMKKYNIPEERVIRHFDVTGKSCPYIYWSNGYLIDFGQSASCTWGKFRDRITGADETKKTTKTKTKKTTKKETKKTVMTLAREVIAGKWGNGADRKRRLEAAGYSYTAVQKQVNKLLKN